MRHNLDCLYQSLSAKVGIPTGSFDIGMPEQLLHLVQASASVDQTRRKAVSQIMHAKLWQPCPDARIVPAVEKGHKGFACALFQKTRGIKATI